MKDKEAEQRSHCAIEKRHAQWEKEHEETQAKRAAELDAKYPSAEGWTGSGTQIRMKIKPRQPEPEFYGDSI